jgi:hypothetical protein
MPLPLAAGALAAKAAAKFCIRWAPYYVLKFGVVYGLRKYPGGVKGLYRTSLRVVRRRYPPGDAVGQHLTSAVQGAFRVPARAGFALESLDATMKEIILQDVEQRRADGIPDEFLEYVRFGAGPRCVARWGWLSNVARQCSTVPSDRVGRSPLVTFRLAALVVWRTGTCCAFDQAAGPLSTRANAAPQAPRGFGRWWLRSTTATNTASQQQCPYNGCGGGGRRGRSTSETSSSSSSSASDGDVGGTRANKTTQLRTSTSRINTIVVVGPFPCHTRIRTRPRA